MASGILTFVCHINVRFPVLHIDLFVLILYFSTEARRSGRFVFDILERLYIIILDIGLGDGDGSRAGPRASRFTFL